MSTSASAKKTISARTQVGTGVEVDGGASASPAPVARQPGEEIRIGYDEMNLVEYPFASLWTKEAAGSIIEHQWETQHPVTGRKVKASWRVTGDPELGLPGPSDERVYLALMELSREARFVQPVVRFTRHDLLKRLGWTHNDKNYRLLVNSFRRLGAAFVSGENAFWDASIKSFRTIGFNILDHYDIVAEPPGRKRRDREAQGELPPSYFKWADVIFASVQAGYIRTLDVGFALSLKGDLALRLFRYLDKKAYDGRKNFEIELSVLCERHLGMKPTRYDSTRKARLKGAHDELLERGFLHQVTFAPMKTKKAEKACYAFSVRRALVSGGKGAERAGRDAVGEAAGEGTTESTTLESVSSSGQERRDGQGRQKLREPQRLREPAETKPRQQTLQPAEVFHPEVSHPEALPPQEASDALVRTEADPLLEQILERILALKVSPEVARELVQSTGREQLQLQLDCLDDRQPRSRAATFVKAVRAEWEAPPKYLERQEAAEQAQKLRAAQGAAQASKAAQRATEGRRRASQQLEETHLDALWEQLDLAEREQIDTQARQNLGVLAQTGRAEGALKAMRRNVMRERGLAASPAGDEEPLS